MKDLDYRMNWDRQDIGPLAHLSSPTTPIEVLGVFALQSSAQELAILCTMRTGTESLHLTSI